MLSWVGSPRCERGRTKASLGRIEIERRCRLVTVHRMAAEVAQIRTLSGTILVNRLNTSLDWLRVRENEVPSRMGRTILTDLCWLAPPTKWVYPVSFETA
jgi:hypothetical protein